MSNWHLSFLFCFLSFFILFSHHPNFLLHPLFVCFLLWFYQFPTSRIAANDIAIFANACKAFLYFSFLFLVSFCFFVCLSPTVSLISRARQNSAFYLILWLLCCAGGSTPSRKKKNREYRKLKKAGTIMMMTMTQQQKQPLLQWL